MIPTSSSKCCDVCENDTEHDECISCSCSGHQSKPDEKGHPNFCSASLKDPAYHHHHDCPLHSQPDESDWVEEKVMEVSDFIWNQNGKHTHNELDAAIRAALHEIRSKERKTKLAEIELHISEDRERTIIELEKLLAKYSEDRPVPPSLLRLFIEEHLLIHPPEDRKGV